MAAKRIKNYFVNPQNKFDYSRSVFKYERTHSTNLLTGAIVPVAYLNCAPGTTVPNKFGFILQSAPLLGPTVDNVYIDIVSAWCPTRLVMADFNEWLGDNDTYAWTLGNNKHLPRITDLWLHTAVNSQQVTKVCSKTYYAEHYLAPHIGNRWFGLQSSGSLTPGIDTSLFLGNTRFKNGIQVIPSRMYDLICNTMFRNENIENPVLFSKQSGTNIALDVTNYKVGLGKIRFANRLKDMYNQARLGPSIQTVDIGLGNDLPVITSTVNHPADVLKSLHLKNVDNNTSIAGKPLGVGTGSDLAANVSGSFSASFGAAPDNLWADLSQLTVNSLYYSIMLQKYMNKASSGRRPVEFYKTMFGISSSDAAHDDPELLSQKRYKVNISRVVSTAASTTGDGNEQGLGTQGAFSVTSVGGTLFPEFIATEYGMFFVFAVIRTQESYSTGCDRYLTDYDLLSTYLPVFDHIGEDSIELAEVTNILPAVSSQIVFGYQTAWYNYRYQVNDVAGVFCPGEPLDYMTFARDFYDVYQPFTINENFIRQSPKEFDRMLQIPVFYGTPGTDDESGAPFDDMGEPIDSNRYQWVIQFALAGDLVATMSKDSEPLLFGSRI